jgi:hypothetical protein
MKKSTMLVGLAALFVLLLLAGRFFLSEADFSMTNPSWNGMYGISQDAGVRPLYDISGLSAVDDNDTLLVVSPTRNYTFDESLTVASFLRRGGRVVVADDFGRANSLLDAIEAPIEVNRAPLCQYENYYVNQSFPVITDITRTPYSPNAGELVLNHPAALNVSGDASVLAASSGDAWLDADDDNRLDNGERMGRYPVVACYAFGAGELIVVSDPDLFINSMLDKGDNGAFMRGLVKGDVWMDASHGRDVTPLGFIYYLIKFDILAQAGALALILAACLALLKRNAILRYLSGQKKN